MALPAFRARGDVRLVHQQDFCTCIRNNLSEYGGGDTCIREHLANADDARATQFTVCLDKYTYLSDNLMTSSMAELQGPALLFSNNAVFKPEHLVSYTQRVGNSCKADDPFSVGKFGKGGLTAYSATDVIQLVTGEQMLILDPCRSYLPDGLASLAINLADKGHRHFIDLSVEASDHLTPFRAFSEAIGSMPLISGDCIFPGSSFRLALRTEAAAERSLISNEPFSSYQIEESFTEFAIKAPPSLLFTRSVQDVITCLMEEGQPGTTVLLHASISPEQTGRSWSMLSRGLQRMVIDIQHADGTFSRQVWLKAVNARSRGSSAGCAVLLEDSAIPGEALPAVHGRVFNTVALPLKDTGLPLHINGAFQVSSERRNLTGGEGDQGQVRERTVLAKSIKTQTVTSLRSVQKLCRYQNALLCLLCLSCSVKVPYLTCQTLPLMLSVLHRELRTKEFCTRTLHPVGPMPLLL